MKKSLILLLSILFASYFSFSQGFKPPTEGKAVVYFTRVSMLGSGTAFEFFHQDKFIGIFKGKNYMRYECDPGNQLFWASSENKEFITADLKAGETYIIMVDVFMGAMKTRVGLTPVPSDNPDFARAKKLIQGAKPIITPQKKIDAISKKLNGRGFIKDKLEQYENDWKNTHKFRHVSPEFAIPRNLLK